MIAPCKLIPVVCFCLAMAVASPGAAEPKPQVEPQLAVFFEKNCIACHGPKKSKGDLRLDQITADLSQRENFERWHEIATRIQSGDMPPKKEPRPEPTQAAAVVRHITARLDEAAAKRRATEGRVVLRRLNRVEYENTVRDLLGVDASLKDMLPLDSSAGGFDNIGDALHISSFSMDRYLEAADIALNQAIANRPQPPSTQKRIGLAETHQVKSTGEKVFRKRDDGSVVMFSSSAWQRISLSPFYPSERGRYRFRISASGAQSAGKPVTFQVWSGSGGMGGPKGHLVGYFDAPPDKSKVFEFIDHMEPKTTISVLPYGLAGAQTVSKVGAEAWTEPGLAIDWIEVEGPFNETWPPESHRRIFGNLKQASSPIYNVRDRVEVVSASATSDVRIILTNFARRAFRRPVADAELKPILALVEARLAEKYSFEKAVRVGLLAVMASPEFLFLREPPGRLDDFALASRLSYFLWSTMPDDELLALAGQQKLSQPGVLHAQVERMLNHPKSAAFTENFTGQWLGLRDIDFTIPSHILYPDYDDMLKASMVRETELFFAEVLKNDLSVTNFIASDFTMLNGRLARHYKIPGVDGWEFRRVSLPPESHRGGVMTMASVMKVTANGTSTSPVTRGAWVLDRILGTPPPKPPENIAALEPDIRGATTIRDQLAKHRQIESCASCHVKIDPPGFALESFDVIGGWRDRYVLDGRRANFREGLKVDPSDVLPDGRKFRNIDELKQLLLADKDMIARALTTKLVTYATGSVPESADQTEIRAIVAKVSAKNYGFRSLIHEIVGSKLFQTK
jgi:mono/diheme cytochrome c family protein